MTQNLTRLQIAVDDATFHRQRTKDTEKQPMERPLVAEDVRHLYLGPQHYIMLERWIKSFKDTRRRDWGKVVDAMNQLTAEDRACAWAHFIVRLAPSDPQP